MLDHIYAPAPSRQADCTTATAEQVVEALIAVTARQAISLDRPTRNPDDQRFREVAVEERGFARAEDAVMLNGLAQNLSAREREILRLRFQEDRVQSEIAETMGLSQMHVSRLIRDAIEQLRSSANSDQGRDRSAGRVDTSTKGERGR